MTSIASSNLSPSVLPKPPTNTKNSSPTSIKKEVHNNNTPRPSNGNTTKPMPTNKKEPTPTSTIKRKTRVLSSSDDSDDDNQSLVRINAVFLPPIFFLFNNLFSYLLSF